MILQAQALGAGGEVVIYEDRDCNSPHEASAFRSQFQHDHYRRSDQVRVVSLCGALAVKFPDISHERDEDA